MIVSIILRRERVRQGKSEMILRCMTILW